MNNVRLSSSVLNLSVTVPTAPAYPAPVDFASYRPGALLIPAEARSAFTVFWSDPANPAKNWLAMGFDVKRNVVLFHVRGAFGTKDLYNFRAQLNQELYARESGVDTTFSNCMSGYPSGPGPINPGPGPSIHDAEEARTAAYAIAQVMGAHASTAP